MPPPCCGFVLVLLLVAYLFEQRNLLLEQSTEPAEMLYAESCFQRVVEVDESLLVAVTAV